MTLDLSRLDAIAQAELVASKALSALELVDAAIARIEALEPQVNALASTDFELARARAKAAPSGPLGGVPFLIKDLLPYPGMRHSMGSRLFAQNVATEGSPYTERLDAAGLITLGKSTTSEFGLLGSTESRQSGVTRNPWNTALSAGGSSGGAAAAVAAGMVPLAHASDGGGSIRIPASMCGVFGFKPGRGRCVTTGRGFAFDLLVDHCVSRSVRDSALLLALTEPAAGETGSPLGFIREPLRRRLRIGVYRTTLMGREPEPEVAQSLEQTAKLCETLGHEVIPVAAPPIDGNGVGEAFFTLAGAMVDGLAQMMAGHLGRAIGEEAFEPFTLALMQWYREQPEGAQERAIERCTEQGERMQAYLKGFDAVLSPTIPVQPWALGTLSPERDFDTVIENTGRLAGYTPIHNVAGVPAMSVPLFRGPSGLPIGSHFAAARGEEAVLLGLAYQLEEAAPWQDELPAHRGVR
ncbi:amidase [Endothiovibrio diazotrophicus]